MTSLTLRRIIGTLLFFLLFIGLFHEAGAILMHKQIEGKWNMTAKVAGFYNEKPDSFDVMFFGSSHMYCSVDPALLKEQTGLRSYIFATQKQPLWITYYYMKEALKTQRPKIAVVEINMAAEKGAYLDEGTNHTAIDPLPLSFNKLRMIWAAAPKGERRFYVFPIMKYHSRWPELTRDDYQRTYARTTDPDKGFVRLDTTASGLTRVDVSKIAGVTPLSEKNRQYLDAMIHLAKKRHVRLIFLKTPSNVTVEEQQYYNAVSEWVKKSGTAYLNCNTDEIYHAIGLDLAKDFYDRRHLNEKGSIKFTKWFIPYLVDAEKAKAP